MVDIFFSYFFLNFNDIAVVGVVSCLLFAFFILLNILTSDPTTATAILSYLSEAMYDRTNILKKIWIKMRKLLYNRNSPLTSSPHTLSSLHGHLHHSQIFELGFHALEVEMLYPCEECGMSKANINNKFVWRTTGLRERGGMDWGGRQ